MSAYSEILTTTVPGDLYWIACAIARALDPDTGGAASYGPFVEGQTTYTTSGACTPEFKAQALAMISAPARLHGAVCADYAARWPDLVPPTLAECEAFCALVSVEQPISQEG